jgi:hypothetical protein
MDERYVAKSPAVLAFLPYFLTAFRHTDGPSIQIVEARPNELPDDREPW